jgi:hypothetical protein
MSEEEAVAPRRFVAAGDAAVDDLPVCWVCQEGEATSEEEGKLVHAGCGCRGSSGFVHIRCLLAAANGQTPTLDQIIQSTPAVETPDGERLAHIDDILAASRSTPTPGKFWRCCPICEQFYTGEAELGLAEARWEQVGGNETTGVRDLMWWLEEGRTEACTYLARAKTIDDPPGALTLCEQLLPVKQKVIGPNHPNTLAIVADMAQCHAMSGDIDEAAKLLAHVLRVTRKFPNGGGNFGPVPLEPGETTETQAARNVGFATNNYGGCLLDMGRLAPARALVREGLELRRRVFGESSEDTLASMSLYARCLVAVGDYFAATQLFEQTSVAVRTLLGAAHPDVIAGAESWHKAKEEMQAWPPATRAVASPGDPTAAGNPPTAAMHRSEVVVELPMLAVLGLDEASGRYKCVHGAGEEKWEGELQPSALIFNDGTVVTIQGLQAAAAQQWNGRSGFVQGFDAEKGRYTVSVVGRPKPLGLKPDCCRLLLTEEPKSED